MMSETDKRILEIQCPDLMRKIDLDSSDLLAQLVRRAAITTQQKEVIQTKEGNRKQVEALVGILLRGNEDTMDKFIYSLRASGHEETAATLLRPPLKDDSTYRQELTVCLTATFKDIRRRQSLPSQEESGIVEFFRKIERYVLDLLKMVTKLPAVKRGAGYRFIAELISCSRELLACFDGSIVFLVKCPSLLALDDLKRAVESYKLQRLFKEDFFTPELMARFRITSIDVQMSINMEEYKQCAEELLAAETQREMEELAIGGQEEVGPKAKEESKQLVRLMLDDVELNATALYNILRWWNGEISGARCAQNVVEATANFLASGAGGVAGAALGAAVGGPVGSVVGGIIGMVLASSVVSRLTSRLTRELFDLPNTVAEERAYNYLGVHHSDPNSEVNRAFRELCRRHHPDRGGDKEEFVFLQNNMAVIKAGRGELKVN